MSCRKLTLRLLSISVLLLALFLFGAQSTAFSPFAAEINTCAEMEFEVSLDNDTNEPDSLSASMSYRASALAAPGGLAPRSLEFHPPTTEVVLPGIRGSPFFLST